MPSLIVLLLTPTAPGIVRDGEPWLAYVSGPPGAARVYVIRADGAGRRRLPSRTLEAASPAWSADGARLAFVGTDGPTSQVFVVGADGSALRQMTRPPESHVSPVWAPVGAALAFTAHGAGGERTVYVADVRGVSRRRLGAGYAPAWSPDGQFVAFLGGSRGFAELYVVSASGGRARRIETSVDGIARGVTGFAWAPDGRRIAYTSRSGPAQEEIRIVDLERGTARWVSTGYAPAWSPDGARLAFTVSRVGSAYVAVAPASGGGARAVTDRRGIAVRPVWAPDGRYLAVVSVRGADVGLYLIRPDGRGTRRLDAIYADFDRGPLVAWRPR